MVRLALLIGIWINSTLAPVQGWSEGNSNHCPFNGVTDATKPENTLCLNAPSGRPSAISRRISREN